MPAGRAQKAGTNLFAVAKKTEMHSKSQDKYNVTFQGQPPGTFQMDGRLDKGAISPGENKAQ